MAIPDISGLYTQVPSETCLVRSLDLEKVKPRRAGVIPFTIVDGQKWFCLGVDAKTGDLSDFGGRVEYGRDGDAVTGALREFEEESLGCFSDIVIERKDVDDCVAVHNITSDVIIFVKFDVKMEEVVSKFEKTKEEAERGEGMNDPAVRDVCNICNTCSTSNVSSSNVSSSYVSSSCVSSSCVNNRCMLEMSEIRWLNRDEFDSCIAKPGMMYERPRKLLFNADRAVLLL